MPIVAGGKDSQTGRTDFRGSGQLDSETTRVSLTIGGNDIGFSEIALSCVTLNPFSTPCKNKYDSGGKDQIAERIAATAPKVAAVLQGIHSRSPAAK